MTTTGKNRLLLDLDGVIADTHRGAVERGILTSTPSEWFWHEDDCGASVNDVFCTPGIFRDAPLMEGALEAVYQLSETFDLWFVSAPWMTVEALSWTEKAQWVDHHFGRKFKERLVLCTDKRLIPAVALVDDNPFQKPGPWTHVLYPRPWNDNGQRWDTVMEGTLSWSTGLARALEQRFAKWTATPNIVELLANAGPEINDHVIALHHELAQLREVLRTTHAQMMAERDVVDRAGATFERILSRKQHEVDSLREARRQLKVRVRRLEEGRGAYLAAINHIADYLPRRTFKVATETLPPEWFAK